MKQYKLKIYDNKRIVVNMHEFNPFKNKKIFNGNKRTKTVKEYMSKKDYQLLMKKWCGKFFSLNIDSTKCKFITLTCANLEKWDILMTKFESFLSSVTRHFGKEMKYIRTVEVQTDSKNFHIHLILIFENTLPTIPKQWLDKYWKLGHSHTDNMRNVDDIYGLLQYLTLFKEGSIQVEYPSLTHFPKGARIISMSNDIPASNLITLDISETEYQHLISYYEKEYYTNNGKLIREDGHYYPSGNILKFCLDKKYIQSSENFIDSNYGL